MAPSQAEVAVLRSWATLLGSGGGWVKEKGNRSPVFPVCRPGMEARADLGSHSSWEREINECADALPFY